MWILKWLVCLMHDHIFIDAGWKDLQYRYCLRCSKVMQPVKVKGNLKGLCDSSTEAPRELTCS